MNSLSNYVPSGNYFTLCVLFADERDEAAEGGLATAKFPGEAADPDALVQHLINLAAGVFDMEDAVGEHVIVHELQIIIGPDFLQGFAQLLRRISPPRSGRTLRMTVFMG